MAAFRSNKYVAFALIVATLASCHGLPSAADAATITNHTLNSDPALPNGGAPARFLREVHADDGKDEERGIGSKLKSIFKKNPSVLTTLQRHPFVKNVDTKTVVKSLERNPTIKSLANNPSKKIKLTQENIKKIDTALDQTSGIANEIKTHIMLLLILLAPMVVTGLTIYGLMAVVEKGLNVPGY